MKPIVRSILAVVAGVVMAMVVIVLNDLLAFYVYPLPAGVDRNNMDAIRAAVPDMPAAAFAMILSGWLIGAMVGGLLAAWIAGRAPYLHAGTVGAIVMLATLANLFSLPHPWWVNVMGVLLPVPLALLAATVLPNRAQQPGPV